VATVRVVELVLRFEDLPPGKTQAQLRSLHFRRDRDWLQS
jgi:hypothetical protein